MSNDVTVLMFNCPKCGEDNRLGAMLSNKVKEDGWMRKERNFYAYKLEGIVIDPTMDERRPIGSKAPAFRIYLDVCMNDGCIYAAKVEIHQVTKTLKQPRAPLGGGGGDLPFF
jgi:hypothetical protein